MRKNQEGELWAVTIGQLLFRLMKMFLDVFIETPKLEASGWASPLRRWSDIWGKSPLILAHILPDTQLWSVSCKGCTVTRCFSSFSTSSHDGILALILATGSGDHKQKAPDQSQIGMTISMWELLEEGGKPRKAHGSRLHFWRTSQTGQGARSYSQWEQTLLCSAVLLCSLNLVLSCIYLHGVGQSKPIASLWTYTHKLFSIWARAILAEKQHEWAVSRFQCENNPFAFCAC